MTIYAGRNKKIEELRELLSSKPNGNGYEILGNTPKYTKTVLVKLYGGRREHRIIKEWDSNYFAWLEMKEFDWTPDKVFEEISAPTPLLTLSDMHTRGASIKPLVALEIECLLQLLDHTKVLGYIPKKVLIKALEEARMDWMYLNKNL